MSSKPRNSGNIIKMERQETNPLLDKLFKNAGISTPNEKINQSWEDLDDIYKVIAESIVSTAQEVNSCVQMINSAIDKADPELVISVRGLTRDIETFTQELLTIRSRHAGMSGVIKDGDELMLCMGVFNDYTILQDRFRAMAFPVMLTVTEFMSDLHSVQSKDHLTDPTVISDIEVKQTEPN